MFGKLQNLSRLIKRLNTLTLGVSACDIIPQGDYKHSKVLMGKILDRLNQGMENVGPLRDFEFQVFSQFGDDGIIQHVIRNVSYIPRTFVEFGVESYVESNTRFLLINNQWSGLVIDGSEAYVRAIQGDRISTLFDLRAICAFITAENINSVLNSSGFGDELGILSIDIDGVDYWVWKAMSVTRPTVVVVEYNSIFGSQRAITVPYDPSFARSKAHHSLMYWGASVAAFATLAAQKGYSFIGCNGNGNNAYFVRTDRLGKLKAVPVGEGFVEASFNEFAIGNQRIRGAEKAAVIAGLPVFNVVTNEVEPF